MSNEKKIVTLKTFINNVKDIVVFLGLKVLHSYKSYMFSCSRNAQFTFFSFQNYGHWYLIYTFKGTVVNRVLPSLHEIPLEITLTVPISRVACRFKTIRKFLSFSIFYRDDLCELSIDLLHRLKVTFEENPQL